MKAALNSLRFRAAALRKGVGNVDGSGGRIVGKWPF